MDKFLNFLGLVKRSGNILEGYNKCEEALGKKSICLIVLSNDISERTKERFLKYCLKYNIPYINKFSKQELGYSVGKNELNILAITNLNMANKLKSYNENN